MPKATAYAVIWSPQRGRYEWYHQAGRTPHPLDQQDEARFIGLIDGSSFSFQGKHGHLTLRKELRRSGAGYWYAYRALGHQTRKKYVGRPADLTMARLEQIAKALTSEPHIEAATDERSQEHAGSSSDVRAVAVSEERIAFLQEWTAESSSIQITPLLAPKFHLPRLHASLLARPRLLTRLESGLEGKLTLLSAPAGFGKTTVVTQWVAAQRLHPQPAPVAWISLDPGDNDPMRFWRYIMTACQAFQTPQDQSALALLESIPRSPFVLSPPEGLLRTFLNELASLPQRSILILEDYHLITSQEIHTSLAFLLEHLPAPLHLIMMTRFDPPLPLARMRARGELNELDADELRFLPEETSSFLQHVLPAVLSHQDLSHLDRRLEGWATGLRLVTLALQRRLSKPEIEDFLATFSGGQRYLLEFFVTEVLATQPAALQNFLLQTSILDRLSVALCDAVLGSEVSEQFLKAIDDANLFLQPLDGYGQWYRYHPLFAEAMQQEARQRFGEAALRSWYSRARDWYEQQHMLPEAVEMALRAQEFARVAALIEQSLRPHYAYQKMNEYYTLQRWLDALPEDMLGQHPQLCLRVVLLLLFSSEGRADCRPSTLARIERLLQKVESAWEAEGNQRGYGELLAIRALISGEQGAWARAAGFARQALTLLPEAEAQWRGSCCRLLGEEALQTGQISLARQLLQEAWALFEVAGNRHGGRATLLALADASMLQGELHQAAEFYRVVLTTAGGDLSDKGEARLGLARLSYEWNALETAEQEAQEALDLGRRLLDEALQVQASLVLAAIEHVRGQTAVAQQRLHARLAQLSGGATPQLPLLLRQILAALARLSLAAGDLAAVERWTMTSALHKESLLQLQQAQEDLIALRLLLVNGEIEKALGLLEGWRVQAHQQGRIRYEIEIQMLTALAFFAYQRRPRAFSLLKEVLARAQAEGYQRLFLDEGEEMAVILRGTLSTIRNSQLETYVQNLLQAFVKPQTPQSASSASNSPISAPLGGPLSHQEQRVLRLLVAGCSNQEIAETLVVSINTIKTQVRSIYQKLNVRSRREARLAIRSQDVL